MRPEGHLPPHAFEERPVDRVDLRASQRAHRHARRQRRDHARDVEHLVGDDVGQIGERQGQRRLGERIVARPADQGQHQAPGHAENPTTDKGDEERNRAVAQMRLGPGDDDAKQHGVGHDRRRVVEHSKFIRILGNLLAMQELDSLSCSVEVQTRILLPNGGGVCLRRPAAAGSGRDEDPDPEPREPVPTPDPMTEADWQAWCDSAMGAG